MPITKPSNFARSFGASIGYAGFGGAYIFVNTSSGRVSAILTKGSVAVDQTKGIRHILVYCGFASRLFDAALDSFRHY